MGLERLYKPFLVGAAGQADEQPGGLFVEGRKRATDPEAVAPCQATSTEAVRPRRANSLMNRNC